MNMLQRDPGTDRTWRVHLLLLLLAAAAIMIGIYARFKGIGKWSLGIDEYYTARAIENVLRSGLPEYACGGWYTRGLIVQYLAAGLQLLGASPEFAPRLIAAVSSLIALPAVYLLGCRAHSRTVGLLAVLVLALSAWEVEMARFARMYAPFQAVFVWYLVFFLKYTVDRQARALWGMVALSVVGVMVWEGGALLAAANFLPPLLQNSAARNSPNAYRLSWRQLRYFAGMALLFVPLYRFATNKLRFVGAQSPFPPDYDVGDSWDDADGDGDAAPDTAISLWNVFADHWHWALVVLVPLVFGLWSLRWIASLRHRWLTAAGLLAALAAATLGQYMLAASALLLLLLFGFLGWRELFSRAALPFWIALATGAVAWFVYGLYTADADPDAPTTWLRGVAGIVYDLLSFPDPLMEIGLPWMRAVPILTLGVFGLLAVACLRIVLRDENRLEPLHALTLVAVCLLLAASASNPPRHETRYVFFLYPVLVLIALSTLAWLVSMLAARFSPGMRPTGLTLAIAATGLGAFALTEDFSPHHLLYVDSAAVHFREGMPSRLAAHFYPRSNTRGAAEWLRAHRTPGALVINSYQSFEFYYPETDYFFMDWHDRRFGGWSCRGGTADRWGNQPLLYTREAFERQLDSGRPVFYVTDRRAMERMLPSLTRWTPRVIWQQHNIAIVTLRRSGS